MENTKKLTDYNWVAPENALELLEGLGGTELCKLVAEGNSLKDIFPNDQKLVENKGHYEDCLHVYFSIGNGISVDFVSYENDSNEDDINLDVTDEEKAFFAKIVQAELIKSIQVKDFDCVDNLSNYVESMLFDSNEVVASGKFYFLGNKVEVSLEVRGEVAVDYKGETYHKPSEFPEELKELIKEHPYDWSVYSPSGEGNDDCEGNIYVGMNNWFEYIYEAADYSDGIVCEDDISKETPESILEGLKGIAAWCFRLTEVIDS